MTDRFCRRCHSRLEPEANRFCSDECLGPYLDSEPSDLDPEDVPAGEYYDLPEFCYAEFDLRGDYSDTDEDDDSVWEPSTDSDGFGAHG